MTSSGTTKRWARSWAWLWLLATLIFVPCVSAQRNLYTAIQASPEPLPNCVPAVTGQTQPLIWDITAQLFKTCTATNTWSAIGGSGGSSYNQTIQVNGSAQSQQATVNFVASTNMSITGSTVGSVTTLTFVATAPSFAAVTPGTNTGALLIGTGGSLGVTGSGTIAATTAAALAAVPTPCSSGYAPTGVLANGNSTGCTAFLANTMTAIGQMLGGGAGGAITTIAAGLTGQVPTATNGATPAFQSQGLPGGNGATPVSASSYTVKCDNSTTELDRGTTIRFVSGASAVTVPDPTTSGCGNNFAFAIIADGVSLTVSRTSTAQFYVYNGATSVDAVNSFTMTTGQFATLNSPDNTNYYVRISPSVTAASTSTTIVTSSTQTVTASPPSQYFVNENATASAAVAFNLPTAAANLQDCFTNSYNGSAATTGALTIQTSAAGQFIIYTDGTLSATGGYVISGGAAMDAACVIGVDSTHWLLYIQRGTWTKH
jgi:hypothetical protein